jgi:hypothetical protein
MHKFLAGAALAGALTLSGPAAADGPLPPECARFYTEADKPQDFAPRLARLCVRLITAFGTPSGLSQEEHMAATRLGTYLAILGELDLRKGNAGIGAQTRARAATTETARYLIAYRIGLLEIADRLAPYQRTASLN